jgi:Fe-S cluster assembly iron-binding protein IscA
MLKLSPNIISYFKEINAKKIKIYFYNSGCSWTKLDIISDFEIDKSVEFLKEEDKIEIYIEKMEKNKLQYCSITMVSVADHTWTSKNRYIYSSDKVKDRCWCWSSFSFWEGKKIKIDLSKIKSFKNNFKK